MSFCADLKKELIRLKTPACCRQPLAYGFMLFGRSFSYKKISVQTSNICVAEGYRDVVKQAYKADVSLTSGGDKRITYRAEVSSQADRLKILASVDYGMTESPINTEVFRRECCAIAFIRGAFLACGNINDPDRDYRAEFSVKDGALALALRELLSEYGISVNMSVRNKHSILYMRDSGTIEDFLTLIGAAHRSLEIMDTKIMKSVKNNINRARNCDNANISKTVEASIIQRRAIEYFEKNDRLQSLPHELLQAAVLRKNNPEATLKELCGISDEPITVSGLNHRLQKIIELYEKDKKAGETV